MTNIWELKPAILYKDAIIKCFEERLYTNESFLYTGYGYGNNIPDIVAEDNLYQYAILGRGDVIGYIAYTIDPVTDTAQQFSLISFDPGNVFVGKAVLYVINQLLRNCRRIEWRMVSGNPVESTYDKFCKAHGGNKVVLHQVTKDPAGQYRDIIVYEILHSGKGVEGIQ